MSLAVIFCGLSLFAAKPVNVTKKYMENYTDPYEYKNKFNAAGDTVLEFDEDQYLMAEPHLSVTLGGGADTYSVNTPRYHVLGAPWKTEGLIGTIGADDATEGATCWHVDLAKGKSGRIRGTLTLTSGWGDFATSFDNMKVSQKTKSIPTGKYDLKLKWGQDRSGAEYTFLVVTKGESIPDTADLVNGTDPNVLGYARLSTELPHNLAAKVSFELTEDAPVTVGLVASFPEHETEGQGYCSAMGDFSLIAWIDGTNYDDLKLKYNEVKNYSTETEYPLGVEPGNYSQEKWDAFVVARDAAKEVIDNIAEGDPSDPEYKDAHTQEQVDAVLKALEDALAELDASLILPIKYSTNAKSYYYRVSDMRSTPDYLIIQEDQGDDGITTFRRLKVVQEFQQNENNIFKFVETDKGFYIYSKSDEENPVSRKEGNLVVIDENVTPTIWVFGTPTSQGSEGRFLIKEQSSGDQMNLNFAGQGIVGFWNHSNDVGNALRFERVYLEDEIDFAKLNELLLNSKKITAENYPIGTGLAEFSQEKWDAFVAARTAAEEVSAKESTNSATQEEVNAAVTALETAITELDKSMNPPFLFSDDKEEHYYLVHDKRTTRNDEDVVVPNYYFWQIAEAQVGEANIQRLVISQNVDNDDDSFRFKFVKDAEKENHFNIYSKTNPTVPLVVNTDEENVIQIDVDENYTTTPFKYGRTPVKDVKYFTVSYLKEEQDEEGNDVYDQLNSYTKSNIVGVWNPSSDDPGNDWTFIEKYDTGVKEVSVSDLDVYVKEGRVLSTDVNAELNVYSVSGQKVDVKRQLNAGVYIVTVAGKQGAAKVVVK